MIYAALIELQQGSYDGSDAYRILLLAAAYGEYVSGSSS